MKYKKIAISLIFGLLLLRCAATNEHQTLADSLFGKIEERLDEHIREKYVTTPYHIDLMGYVAFLFTAVLAMAAFHTFVEKKKIRKLRKSVEKKHEDLQNALKPFEENLHRLTISNNHFIGQTLGEIAMILMTQRAITPDVYEKLDLCINQASIFAPDLTIRRQALLKIRARGNKSALESLDMLIFDRNERDDVKKWASEAKEAILLRGI